MNAAAKGKWDGDSGPTGSSRGHQGSLDADADPRRPAKRGPFLVAAL